MQGRRSKEKPKCYYQRQLFILSEHTDGLSPAKSLCQIDAPNSAPLFTHIFKSILNPGYDRTTPFRFIPDTIPMPLWVFGQHFCWDKIDNIWPNQYVESDVLFIIWPLKTMLLFHRSKQRGQKLSLLLLESTILQFYELKLTLLKPQIYFRGWIKRRWFNIDCAAVSIALFGPVFVRCLTW